MAKTQEPCKSIDIDWSYFVGELGFKLNPPLPIIGLSKRNLHMYFKILVQHDNMVK